MHGIKKILISAISAIAPERLRNTKPLAFLIKLDAIGDYILFRNFIHTLVESKEYKGFQWIFVCSPAVRELASSLDGYHFVKIISLDLDRYETSAGYRMKSLVRLKRFSPALVLHPVLSRMSWVDTLIRDIAAPENVGSEGDCSNSSLDERTTGNAAYTKLIPASPEVLFEFERNREFFSALLSKPLDDLKLSLPDSGEALVTEKYVVLLPGSKESKKLWPIASYIAVASWLLEHTSLHILVCGGPSEKVLASNVMDALSNKRIVNCCGKYALSQMLNVMQHATYVVGNDTGLMHMRAAHHVPGLCISNGKEVLRFHPYPQAYRNPLTFCYPPEMGENVEHAQELRNQFGIRWGIPADRVSVDQVIAILEKSSLLSSIAE